MKRRTFIGIAAILVFIAGAVAYQAAASVVRPSREDVQSINRMKSLDATQLTRLKSDYREFYKLTPEERRNYQDLHAKLQQAGEYKQLREISSNFYQWYLELGQRQRSEIRAAKDHREKMALVQEFQREADEKPRFDKYRGRRRRQLSRQDFAAVMKAIEEKLREEHADSDKLAELESKTGYELHHAILSLLFDHVGGNLRNERERENLRHFFNDDRFLNAISSGRTRKDLEREREWGNRRIGPDTRLPIVLVTDMGAAFMEEVAKRKPSDEKLMKEFQQMDPEEQDKLLLMTADEAMRRLTMHYVETYPGEFPPKMDTLIKNLWPRGDRSGFRRQGGEGPRDDRRGRRGPDRDRPRRRPAPGPNGPPPGPPPR